VLQVCIEADACAATPSALTAPLQVPVQAVAHEVIEMAKRRSRVSQAKVISPAAQVSVQFANQFGQGCMALAGVDHPPQHFPFPSHRFTRWHQV
jgi:hypothetical protein